MLCKKLFSGRGSFGNDVVSKRFGESNLVFGVILPYTIVGDDSLNSPNEGLVIAIRVCVAKVCELVEPVPTLRPVSVP